MLMHSKIGKDRTTLSFTHGVGPVASPGCDLAFAMRLREKIMQLAADADAPVDLFVCAMADVLGMAIAKQDREAGTKTLKDRLHLFCGRVEETYEGNR